MDIIHFDEIVSPQEVKILQQTHSSDTDEEYSDDGTLTIKSGRPVSLTNLTINYVSCLHHADIGGAQDYQMVLKAIKSNFRSIHAFNSDLTTRTLL